MRYKLFGRSGLRVSEICLGAMTFGNQNWGCDTAESLAILDDYAQAGGNFIDTAHMYGDGESEKIVGEFIASDRDNFVVATKFAPTRNRSLTRSGAGRKNMIRSLEESLRRLNTDYIDLYYLHMWDAMTPLEEVMRGLDDLVRAGKILHIAISDTPAWEISRANMLADLRGWAPFIGIQIEYSLIQRTPERELLPMARELDLGVVAWAPLAGGALASPEGGVRQAMRSAQASDRSMRIATVVREVATMLGVHPAQVALAALGQLDPSRRVLPIVGASSRDQLAVNLGAIDLHLDKEQLARIDAESRVELGFPHDMLASPMIRDLLTGGYEAQLDDHRHNPAMEGRPANAG